MATLHSFRRSHKDALLSVPFLRLVFFVFLVFSNSVSFLLSFYTLGLYALSTTN